MWEERETGSTERSADWEKPALMSEAEMNKELAFLEESQLFCLAQNEFFHSKFLLESQIHPLYRWCAEGGGLVSRERGQMPKTQTESTAQAVLLLKTTD